MDVIDITMPVTLRPEILKRTLESFCKNIFTDRDRYRLVFNVDCVGEKINPSEIVAICNSFFKNIRYNISEKPSFPRAFKWCWLNATSKYVFHMNEDWELMRPVDIDHLIKILDENETLACVKLSKMEISDRYKLVRLFNCLYAPKDGFLKASRKDDQFGTNPELIRGEFIRKAAKLLSNKYNPEKQFRRSHYHMFVDVVVEWDYAVYGKKGDKALIEDIGQEWMNEHGFQKKNGNGFTEWEKT